MFASGVHSTTSARAAATRNKASAMASSGLLIAHGRLASAKRQVLTRSGLIFGSVSFRSFGMQIYVGKNGQQLGPFSLEEVNRKLADGTFAASDLAWYEGAAGWAPLSSVTGVVVPPAAAAT